jgi:hypothetical protein
MNPPRLQLLGLAALFGISMCIGGFIIGRKSVKPPAATERIVYRDRVVKESATTVDKTESNQSNAKVVTKWRQRIVTTDGKCQETEGERTETGASTSTKTATKTDTSRDNRETDRVIEKSIPVAPKQHRLIIGTAGRLDLKLNAGVDVYAGLRIAGPVETGISYDVLNKRPAGWLRIEGRF